MFGFIKSNRREISSLENLQVWSKIGHMFKQIILRAGAGLSAILLIFQVNYVHAGSTECAQAASYMGSFNDEDACNRPDLFLASIDKAQKACSGLAPASDFDNARRDAKTQIESQCKKANVNTSTNTSNTGGSDGNGKSVENGGNSNTASSASLNGESSANEQMRQCKESAQQGGLAGTAMKKFVENCSASKLKNFPKTQKSSVNRSVENEEEGITFHPNEKSCLLQRQDASGRTTYTNVCNVRVEFGYCHVNPANPSDGTICRPENSAFTRTGFNYVAQAGGLEPKATHTEAYVYPTGQFTFLVACKKGSPYIEGFNSQTITAGTAAQLGCWRINNKYDKN